MKHLKKIRGLLLLLPFLGLGGLNSCSILGTPEPQLPAETQEGKNTFGCLVNGKVWNAYFGGTDIYNTQATEATFDPFRQGLFSIMATNNGKIYIGIIGIPTEKNYDFVRADSFQIGDMSLRYDSNTCYYGDTNLTYFKGKTRITKFDRQNRIAAGTFECTLKTKDCDTVKITQGRFDMTF
jgi:hypothetical protein